jgi:peptide/nickel transport system substrate-binding protein
LLTGEVDGTFGVPPESLTRLRSGNSGTLYYGEGLTTVNLSVASLKGTLKDVRVRQALMLALDREGFTASALRGAATATGALAAREAWRDVPAKTVDDSYRQLPPIGRDLAKAKELIRQAGAQGRKLTVATSPIGPDVSLLATAVQDAGTRIGLKVELKTVAPDAYTALFSDAEARKGLDLFPYTYYLSVTDPLGVYGNFRTGQFENYAGYSDPLYDQVADRAGEEYNSAERGALTAQLQKMAIDRALCLPVAELPNTVFLGNRITGAPTTIAYMYYPWAADVGARE